MTKTANYKLTGCILNLQSKPVPGLTVHAYDKDLLQKDDILGEATTDDLGRYVIIFSAAQFKKGLEFLGPDVYIRVFHGNHLLGESKAERNCGDEISIDMEIDFDVPEDEAEGFIVSGTVRLAEGSRRLRGQGERLLVEACDQGLRGRALLGKSAVDDQGHYAVTYTKARLLNPERGRANLQIVVTNAADKILAQSPITFNARPVEFINLVVDLDSLESEWWHLSGRIPLLVDEAELPKLTDEELEFLAKSERLNLEHLKIAVKAVHLSTESKLPAWFHYALGRQKLPLELGALLNTNEARVFKALEAAQSENIVDQVSKETWSDLRECFEKLQGDHLLEQELRAGGMKIGRVFAVAGLKDDEQRRLAIALLGKDLQRLDGSFALPADIGLEAGALKRVASALFLADFAEHHEATAKELFREARTHEPRDLAKHFDPHDWKAVVGKTVKDDSDLPGDLEGVTPDERRDAYARRLYTRAASAFPNVAMAYGLSRRKSLSKNVAAKLLPEIVELDRAFDLATTRLDGYLSDKKTGLGLKEDTDISVATNELKRVQRLYRLKPEMNVVATLLEDDDRLDSAAAIVQQGKIRFVEKYGKDKQLGEDTATVIFREAEIVTARAFGFLSHFSKVVNTSVTPNAISDCPAELKGVPDYPSLFGSLDGCECEPCESVYSPAAYLTDLLAFLKREVAPLANYFADASLAVNNGIEALVSRSYCDRDSHLVKQKSRRPDIIGTLLSCRNAETELPYVDLVLEILENAVAPRPGGGAHQTTLDADKLAVQPQYFNEAAYQQLAGAVFPLCLPFDLAHEEQKLYLGKFGTSLAELLETFHSFTRDDDAAFESGTWPDDLNEIRCWQDAKVAKARLELADNDWTVITNSAEIDAVVNWGWGYQGAEAWTELGNVDVLMRRSGLDYKDVLRLLRMKSFNPDGEIKIAEADLGDCDPTSIHLESLSLSSFALLHRFLRLQRKLGLSLREMDQVVQSLSSSNSGAQQSPLNDRLLIRLSHALRLRQQFNLPLVELLAWWSHLETADYGVAQLPHETPTPSLYERLFLTGRKGEATHIAFQLSADRTELVEARQLLGNHLPTIASALRVSLPHLELLITDLSAELVTNGNSPFLNLENLSLLFRHASFARALHLKIEDYVTLKRLIGFDPFTRSELAPNNSIFNTTQTLRFVARANVITDSGFSLAELDYLLRQTLPFAIPTIAPTEEWIEEKLKALAVSLSAITYEDESDSVSAAEWAARQAALAAARRVAIANGLAEPLKISAAVCQVLLYQLPFPVDRNQKVGDALLSGLLTADVTAPMPSSLVESLYLLHKASLIIERLGITHRELLDNNLRSGYLKLSSKVGWLDFARLPIISADSSAQPPRIGDPAQPFDAWKRTVQLFQVRDLLPLDQQEHFFELFAIAENYQIGVRPFASAERRAYIATLFRLSNWPESDLNALVGRFDVGEIADAPRGGIFDAWFPRWFADERLLVRIVAAIQLTRRLSVSAFAVDGWLQPPPAQMPSTLPARVVQIKNALKARYGDDWPAQLKPVSNLLRERQRQLLVAYLMHEWNLERADDLFDHFLIDVEMSPCMMTSRIIQAVAAVQLFVQRVLMNLEPGLYVTDDGAEQWNWMKTYRVWEANRKIFLYPENWIEPELRDDKTPFFKDLENELLQADINNDTAETALVHYLEKLHDVSRLQVVGQYFEFEQETGGNPTLHVFARTRDVPHHYYYRKGIIDGVEEYLTPHREHTVKKPHGVLSPYWTPWEHVDLDIEGDHLIPVVYNRRLYLFWPIFASEDEAPLSHLTQQLMQVFAQLLRLQDFITRLIDGIFKGFSSALIGGLANSIIQVLYAVQEALNHIPVLGASISLVDQREEVRDLRNNLLAIFGVSANDTSIDFGTAGLPDLAGLNDVLDAAKAIVNSFEQHLIELLPAKRLEVQLAWSEFKGDSWSAKKISSGAVTFRDVVSSLFESLPEVPGLGRHGVRRLFTFRGRVEGHNQLVIRCRIALPSSVISQAESIAEGEGWVSEPVEIGLFRLNGCNGRLEAFDEEENLNLVDLLSQGISEILLSARDTLEQLRGDRQLSQRGEPITPDDDPNRPSRLREKLEELPLPDHFYPNPLVPSETLRDGYRIQARHQDITELTKLIGFYYQDALRTFFCVPCELPENNPRSPGDNVPEFGMIFFPFYHPYSCTLLENIRRAGIPGIYLDLYNFFGSVAIPVSDAPGNPLQVGLRNEDFFFDEYQPTVAVYNPPDGDRALRPIEEINFSTIGAYSQYNWRFSFTSHC